MSTELGIEELGDRKLLENAFEVGLQRFAVLLINKEERTASTD